MNTPKEDGGVYNRWLPKWTNKMKEKSVSLIIKETQWDTIYHFAKLDSRAKKKR